MMKTITLQDHTGDWISNPCVPVTSVAHLKNLLQQFSEQEPGMVELKPDEDVRLQLGIGGEFCFAQMITSGDSATCACAKPKAVRATEHVEFVVGGTPTPIAPEYCLSLPETVQLAEHFYTTLKRDPGFEWVEIY